MDVLHAEMTAKQREESVTRMRKGETWVMICTEVMARGMDFGGLRGVLNYDFPQSVQSYVHRIGASRGPSLFALLEHLLPGANVGSKAYT